MRFHCRPIVLLLHCLAGAVYCSGQVVGVAASITPSCGTFTVSTPCAFTLSGQDGYDSWGSSSDYLIMVVQAAGLGSPQYWQDTGPNRCILEFDGANTNVWLADDGGSTSWMLGHVPSTTPIFNRQCSIDLSSASLSHSPGSDSLIAKYSATFTPSFAGQREIYLSSFYGGTHHWVYAGPITIPSVGVTVSPGVAPVSAGLQIAFTANVTNAPNSSVSWNITPTGIGNITASGLYTPPNPISTAQSVTLTATSTVDATKSASATAVLVPPTPWYNAAWSYRRAIAVDRTKVNTASGSTTPLANFPMLVSVTDSDHLSTTNGGKIGSAVGADIVFTAADGVTPLSFEIEKYNPSAGQLIAWVAVPSLSPTQNSVIYEYFGNSSATVPPTALSQGTWDQYFVAVWHMAAFGN